VDPVPDPLLLRKMGQRRESNQGPQYLQPGTLTTRPQRRSSLTLTPDKINVTVFCYTAVADVLFFLQIV
jgi:hypothetical protein